MANRKDFSDGSEALLPGRGHTPSYGINDSTNLEGSSIEAAERNSTIQAIVNPKSGERVWVVAMCSLIACLAALINGLVLGYSSPTLSILTDPTIQSSSELFHQGDKYYNLFGAFGAIGALFGAPIAWPMSEKFGRQATLMLSGLPSVIGWVLIANAHSIPNAISSSNEIDTGFVVVLLTGRFLTGLAAGWSIFAISVYISEIASPKLRGLFGNCNQLFITIGILIASVFGIRFNINGKLQPVPYWAVALLSAGIVVVFEILMLFTYETPRWLFSKGNEHQGIHVLKILRGPNANFSKEIDRIRHALRKTYSLGEQIVEFKNRSVYYPFILVLFLMFFQQFSGINAAIFYAVSILKATQNNTNTANIISVGAVGINQVISTLIAVILVDFLGRRVLLIVSSTGMALSSLMFCAFFAVYDRICDQCLSVNANTTGNCSQFIDVYPCNTSTFGILGIVGMVVFITSFSLAWGPIPWSMMSELLPNRVRSLAASIATFVNWAFASVITFAFTPYANQVTPEFAWFSFAVVMIGSIFFVFLFIPETKGRSLEEIQAHFEKREIFAVSLLQKRSNTSHNSTIEREHPSRLSVTSVSGYNEED